jgi:predicted Rossmann fold flavoprotein
MNGMETKVENELRTFPISNSAQSVWDVLVENLKKNKVEILSNSPVTEIIKDGENIIGVRVKGKAIKARNIIIATGGTSRPETGSTGDAYKWLRGLGHNVVEPKPSLVPIAIKDKWVKTVAGVTLPEVKITILQNEVKQGMNKGKILFTHVGVSGPTILNMSKDIGELLKYGEVYISLDILPKQDLGVLNTSLQELFKKHDKKKLRNALSELVPTAFVPIILDIAKIDGETACNSVKREDRLKLVNTLKAIPMQVDKLLGTEKAIITSGGVMLDEVDFKNMSSRLFSNLYLIGDVLDIDRPSGGYSLQLCWTTGFVAGNSVQ